MTIAHGGVAASHARGVADRPAIRSIYVDPAVALPKEPRLATRGQAIGVALGGVVGGAVGGAAIGGISAAGGGTPEQQFMAYLDSNHVHPDEMLPAAFIDAANSDGVFQVATSADDADAVLKIEVQVYGLGPTANPFSQNYRAFFHARATLTRPGGKVIWSKRVWQTPMDDRWLSASKNDLFTQPELMRAAMAAATREIVDEFVADLRKSGL